MTHGQLPPIGYERSISGQRPPPIRTLKDVRCRDCQMKDPPANQSTIAREACLHKHEFAPSVNRFSILAELDQQASRTKWNFDFFQTPGARPRKRGKRGGKNTKPKFVRQPAYEAQKSESHSVEELCKEMAALCLDDGKLQKESGTTPLSTDVCNGKQQEDYRRAFDDVRHHWMPQFRPNSDATPKSPSTARAAQVSDGVSVLSRPEPCLTQQSSLPSPPGPPPPKSCFELQNFKRKESRFLPVPAFHATFEGAFAHQPSTSPQKPRKILPIRHMVQKKPLIVAFPTSAQKAAASAACRALSNRKTISPPLTTTLAGNKSRPESLSLLTLSSEPLYPNTLSLADAQPFSLPSAPLAITPSSPASPTLTTSTATSMAPSLTTPASVYSTLPNHPWNIVPPPLPLPPRPQLPNLISPVQTWTPISWPSPLPSMQYASSGKSSFPKQASAFCAALPSVPSTLPDLLGPQRLTQHLDCQSQHPRFSTVSAPNSIPVKPSLPSAISAETRKHIEEFLEMGHANPCWCMSHTPTQHIPPAPLPPSLQDEIRLPTPPPTPVESRMQTPMSEHNNALTPGSLNLGFQATVQDESKREDTEDAEKEELDSNLASPTPTLTLSPVGSDCSFISPPPSAIDIGSDFEDLRASGLEDTSPSPSTSSSSSDNGGWTLVNPTARLHTPIPGDSITVTTPPSQTQTQIQTQNIGELEVPDSPTSTSAWETETSVEGEYENPWCDSIYSSISGSVAAPPPPPSHTNDSPPSQILSPNPEPVATPTPGSLPTPCTPWNPLPCAECAACTQVCFCRSSTADEAANAMDGKEKVGVAGPEDSNEWPSLQEAMRNVRGVGRKRQGWGKGNGIGIKRKFS
ncbi:hypothetical protein BCR34DRAFT_212360 [Clohesyomyces aquaticus]|uniref:Uncharacterized protein n=1 Tax=Clohesyomyces aquaticus TaxID=1231657 RepID=A0A1Y1ZX09_9PLEO|nr:hypothetical protein BCR34DRAFT_212360 [Clohesyomyces aquaticus]